MKMNVEHISLSKWILDEAPPKHSINCHEVSYVYNVLDGLVWNLNILQI